MQKNKKVFVSFKTDDGFVFIDIGSIFGFCDKIWNGRPYLTVKTIYKDIDISKVTSKELIDQMSNIEIRGIYAKKQRD